MLIYDMLFKLIEKQPDLKQLSDTLIKCIKKPILMKDSLFQSRF